MRTVVCFGDSNTFGTVPSISRAGKRLSFDRRWPGVMRRALGAEWHVVEAGLPGRTTVHADPVEGAHLCGRTALPIVMESHRPIDMIVIALGINDMKTRFSVTARDIAESLNLLISDIMASAWGPGGIAPDVLLVAPPVISPVDHFAEIFLGCEAKTREVAKHIAEVAARRSVRFLDSSEFIEVSVVDGIHLDADSHRVLGQKVARAIGEK